MSLESKVAIITGSAKGIGKALALGFAREGATVVIADKATEDNPKYPGTIQKTAEEVQQLGSKALAVKCDVTKEEDVDNVVRETLAQFHRIDVLVNNAGVNFYSPFLETSLKGWELVLKVNLTGPFLCCKSALPAMVEQKSGSIINISSGAGIRRTTSGTTVAYGVSKAGLERLTWGLAAEMGKHNIAVNALKPRASVLTEGNKFFFKPEEWAKFDPPDSMVKVAIFLAKQDASGVTGMVATDEEYCAWHGL